MKFHDGSTSNRNGIRVGKYLIVANDQTSIYKNEIWCIYWNTNQRKFAGRVLECWSRNEKEMLALAAQLNELYRNFWELHWVWPEASVFSLAKWTSEKHLYMFCISEMLDAELDKQDRYSLISTGSFKKLGILRQAQDRISYWTRNQNWDHELKGDVGVI